MPEAGRITDVGKVDGDDKHGSSCCPHPSPMGPAGKGSHDVKINGLWALI
jgi:hypothetical protein